MKQVSDIGKRPEGAAISLSFLPPSGPFIPILLSHYLILSSPALTTLYPFPCRVLSNRFMWTRHREGKGKEGNGEKWKDKFLEPFLTYHFLHHILFPRNTDEDNGQER